MSLATYAGLKASIAAWATYTDLGPVIPDFVTWAQQEIGRRLRSNFMLSRADVAITGEFVPQPTNFGSIKTFRLDVADRTTLTVTSPTGIEDAYYQQGPTDNPTMVAVEGANFHFGPAFTATPTGKLLFYAMPTALEADGDTNAVLTKYPYLYLYGALEALFLYKEDDNNADRYGQRFGALLDSINATEAKDAMAGPVQMTTSGFVV